MSIQYVKNKDINFYKWDQCILRSLNGIIYAYSWYLNMVSDNWDALIEDDYVTVMPLVIKRQFNQQIVSTPYYLHQLGIFSIKLLDKKKISDFINAIPLNIRYYDIRLNRYNNVELEGYGKIIKDPCFELDLIKPYHKTKAKYSGKTLETLNNATFKKVSVVEGLSINEMMQFMKQVRSVLPGAIKKDNFKLFRILVASSVRFRLGSVYGAYSEYNELCAITFIIKSHNSLVLLCAAANKTGTENKAIFLLIDNVIKKYSQKNLTLSFEYIDNYCNENFYMGFGSIKSSIIRIRKNNLPFYLRFLKH